MLIRLRQHRQAARARVEWPGRSRLRACDPLPEQRASLLAQVPAVKVFETYEAGLADHPDTVLIGTPPWLHVPQAMQAIRAGCHVLSEKPLSDSADGLDNLAALAAVENKKVMVAHCFRYHDGLLKARRHLDAGRIGRLVSMRRWWASTCPTCVPTTAASSRRSTAAPST